MLDPQPALDGTVNPLAGPPPTTRHTDAVFVKAECAAIISWTTPPHWQRLLTAANDLHDHYWGIVNATDDSRITESLLGRAGLENYETALAAGRRLVGDLDRTVRGATGKNREIEALYVVQDLARKVRALAFELDLQQNHNAAHRQVERFAVMAAAETVAHARQRSPYSHLSYPYCTGGTR